MKHISGPLLNEIRSKSSHIVYGWKLTRGDGVVMGFTSAEFQFVYDSVTYLPTNGLMGSATASKNNLSVDNMSVTSLITDAINEADLKSGRYDNAQVQVFWINPVHPEWGILPLKGGRFGEVQLKNSQFEVELRSIAQFLQQPFGNFYTLECSATLGDEKCKVRLTASPWTASKMFISKAGADAGIGSYVMPTAPNGFWYQCVSARGIQSTVVESTASAGAYVNSAAYLTPTHPGDAPASAPYGAEPFSITTGSAQIFFALGASGGSEPAWPASLGAQVADGELVWQAIQARRWTSTVTAIFSRAQFEDANLPAFPVGYFQYGVINWLTGENAGLSMEIRAFDHDPRPLFFTLEAMSYRVSPGDRYECVVGCAKTRGACVAFDNIHNMRAFPDMPTEDKALATPNFTQQGTQAPADSGGS